MGAPSNITSENNMSKDLVFTNENERARAFEQYKMIVDSLNNINMTREMANGFWITVNSVAVSAFIYMRDSKMFSEHHKYFALWVIIIFGLGFSLSWLNYLSVIKKRSKIMNNLLFTLEEYFPIKVFTHILTISRQSEGKNSLTSFQMFVPALFLGTYIIFGISLFFFAKEVVKI